MFYLQLLGAPDLTGTDGQHVLSVLSQPKRLALLAYLVAGDPDGLHSRDTVLPLLWPDSDLKHARNSLRQSLHYLRRSLGKNTLESVGDGEIAVSSKKLRCDVHAFEAALDSGELEDGLELYRADFLEGLFIPGAHPFEEWMQGERRRLRNRAIEACWELSEQGESEVVRRSWAQRALELNPTDESSVRRCIKLLARLGNRTAALHVYREFHERLRDEYELDPSPEMQAVVESLRDSESTHPVREDSRSPSSTPSVNDERPVSEKKPVPSRLKRIAGSTGWIAAGALLWFSATELPALLPRTTGAPPVKSIAVLPFRAIGTTGGDQFLADAIQQEILSQLARIPSLRVIHRSSVANPEMGFDENPAVARRLGVRYLIRGALQATESEVRVWARLIDGTTDEQLWAGSYERPREDLFEIQITVAERIGEALALHFPQDGKRLLDEGSTSNPAAYEAYLRGRLYSARAVNREDARKAARALATAVTLDPQFAKAHAALSSSRVLLAYVFDDHHQVAEAQEDLARAKNLAPKDPDTWLAEAYYLSYAMQDYEVALDRLAAVARARPSHAEALALRGYIQRRMGRWEAATTTLTDALKLNPNSYTTAVVLGELYLRTRKFRDAERLFDRAIAITPSSEMAYVQKALVYLNGTGDTASARSVLAEAPATVSARSRMLLALTAMFRGDCSQALQVLQNPKSDGSVERLDNLVMQGVIYFLQGEDGLARTYGDSIRLLARKQQGPRTMASAADGKGSLALDEANVAMADVLVGRARHAVVRAEVAAELLPLTADAYWGTEVLERLADVYVLTGRREEAVKTIDQLLSVPSRVTAAALRLNPIYQPLQGEPGFADLLTRYGHGDPEVRAEGPSVSPAPYPVHGVLGGQSVPEPPMSDTERWGSCS